MLLIRHTSNVGLATFKGHTSRPTRMYASQSSCRAYGILLKCLAATECGCINLVY